MIIFILCFYIYYVIIVNGNKYGYIVYIFMMYIKGDNVIGGFRFIVIVIVFVICYFNELFDWINIYLMNL